MNSADDLSARMEMPVSSPKPVKLSAADEEAAVNRLVDEKMAPAIQDAVKQMAIIFKMRPPGQAVAARNAFHALGKLEELLRPVPGAGNAVNAWRDQLREFF